MRNGTGTSTALRQPQVFMSPGRAPGEPPEDGLSRRFALPNGSIMAARGITPSQNP